MTDDRPDDAGELGRQLERGALFLHTALTDQVLRVNESDAIINGLVDLLLADRVIDADALTAAVATARARSANDPEALTVGVTIRADAADAASQPVAEVDCAARLPICRAACCRLRFALSAEEIESGALRWDLGRPYMNRQTSDGYCHRIDSGSLGCGIYEQRPSVCRAYSCAGDGRIWTDFDAMVLNEEWIDGHLGADEPTVIEVFMHATPAPA